MTRTRIHRGLGLLASITVALMGPQSAICEQVISGSSSNNNIVPTSRREVQRGSMSMSELSDRPKAELSETNDVYDVNDARHQRRELSWWGLWLFFSHAPCPPGPLGHHCREHKHHHGSDSSGLSGSSGGDGADGADGSDGSSSYNANYNDGYNGGDDGNGNNGANGGNGGDGGDGSNGYDVSQNLDNTGYSDGSNFSSGGGAPFASPGSKGFWILLVVAAAVATAIAAMVVGSRRGEEKEYHPLRGAVEKRMKLFGGFADRCFEERVLCGSQVRAGETMEMAGSNSLEESRNANYKEMNVV